MLKMQQRILFKSTLLFLLAVVMTFFPCASFAVHDYGPSDPQQVHLSLGRTTTEIVVTWTTYNFSSVGSVYGDHQESVVQFGVKGGKFAQMATGSSTVFTDGGDQRRQHRIHRVLLTGLKPFTAYQYHCGSRATGKWSPVYSFRTLSDKTDWSPRLLVYGDLGLLNGQSIPRIRKEVEAGNVDLIFHAGDFAYDLDSINSHIGDEFMRTLEPIAATIPYQTCVGNHENAYNFSNYVNRFSMYDMSSVNPSSLSHHRHLSQTSNHFYAFYLGPALIISFSTEFYYFVQYGFAPILAQYRWLEAVLEAANRPAARAAHPWIVTFGHRPMYCTDDDGDDCTHHNSIIRTGLPIFHTFGLEELFFRHGVDVTFWAHEHSYERLWPLYDFQVMNGTADRHNPYYNPPAPVQIITGSAGCQERLDHFGEAKPWSAFRLSDYGYTRLAIYNATHLSIEQISDDQAGKVMDAITVVQEKHGPRKSIPLRCPVSKAKSKNQVY